MHKTARKEQKASIKTNALSSSKRKTLKESKLLLVLSVIAVFTVGSFAGFFVGKNYENGFFAQNSTDSVLNQFNNLATKAMNLLDMASEKDISTSDLSSIRKIMDTIDSKYDILSQKISNAYRTEIDILDANYNKTLFNADFRDGIQDSFIVLDNLGKIYSSNKSNKEHIISVTFNSVSSSEANAIKGVINFLESQDQNKKYLITIYHDDNGYVNQYIIDNL